MEVAYRYRTYGARGFSPSAMSTVEVLGGKRVPIRESGYPDIRCLLVPNLDSRFKMVGFRTNSLGHRDDELELPKPEGVFRIAVVGDSFVMGSGVELADCFHSRLEGSLAARFPASRFDCLNLGVGGFDLGDYVGVVERLVPGYDADLVLVGLCWNDCRTPPTPWGGRYVGPPQAEAPSFLRLHSLAALKKRWRTFQQGEDEPAPRATRKETIDKLLAAGGEVEGYRSDDTGMDAIAEYVEGRFRKLAEWSEASGVPVALAYLSFRQDAQAVRFGGVFSDAAEAASLPYLDLAPAFAKHAQEDLIIFANDAHPNARANAIYAGRIEDWLVKHGLVR